MSQVIVYKQDNGVIAVITPTPEYLQDHTIYECAVKDVPQGKKFQIVNYNELPWDYPQESWVMNDSEFTGGTGGSAN
jgi:hypothetical protein